MAKKQRMGACSSSDQNVKKKDMKQKREISKSKTKYDAEENQPKQEIESKQEIKEEKQEIKEEIKFAGTRNSESEHREPEAQASGTYHISAMEFVALSTCSPVEWKLKSWTDLEAILQKKLNAKCEIYSPFAVEHIKADKQIEKHGTCHVLCSVLLVHAHQALEHLQANALHDASWLEAKLSSMGGKSIAEGGVPRVAFELLLGTPASTEFNNQFAILSAVDCVQRMGGVLPYSPSQCMMKNNSTSDDLVLVVEKDAYIDQWNQMKPVDHHWHALMVAGVIFVNEEPKYWLCKQTWQGYAPFVAVPIVIRSEVSANENLLCLMSPELKQMKKAHSISASVMALNDGSALPDSYAYLPEAGSS